MYRTDHYYDYEELTAYLRELPERFPGLVSIESIGKSAEGRELWVATIGVQDGSLPAYWIDGNTHGTEVTASSACLHTIEHLCTRNAEPQVAALLERVIFYIAPRINPDGAEHFLKTGRYVRSAPRSYPDGDAIPTFTREDVDGDGEALQMRWEDPDGAWKVSARDKRAMVPRTPWDTESDGPFYNLTAEGYFSEDGWERGDFPIEHMSTFLLDFNRNYPHGWRPQHEQHGAGDFPLSEPETRAVVEFMFAHRNICGVLTHHTFSGVLLRPYMDRDDNKMPKFDLQTYKAIGDKSEELTGYPCLSVFHDFKYDPVKFESGVFDDWVYEHFGVHAYTMELWDPMQRAGIDTSDGFLRPWFYPTEDDQLKLLQWNDSELDGEAVKPWTECEHRQLGKVEVGGWRWQFSRRNPPPHLLEETSFKGVQTALVHAATLPELTLQLESTRIDADTVRIDAKLQNRGFLPTDITSHARAKGIARPTSVAIELHGLEMLSGESVQRVDHLDGIWNQTVPHVLSMSTSGKTRKDLKRIRWIVRGSGTATVQWFGDRIGRRTAEIEI